MPDVQVDYMISYPNLVRMLFRDDVDVVECPDCNIHLAQIANPNPDDQDWELFTTARILHDCYHHPRRFHETTGRDVEQSVTLATSGFTGQALEKMNKLAHTGLRGVMLELGFPVADMDKVFNPQGEGNEQ